MLAEVIMFIVFICLTAFYLGQRPKDMPPGPTVTLPIIGNLIQLVRSGKETFIALDKLSKKYGDIFTLRFGTKDMVILASYKAMKDTMGKEEWNGRISTPEIKARYLNQHLGMIFLDGEPWKEQRRFTIRHLRDFGFGKQASMEKIIHEELHELTSRIRQQMGDGIQTVLHMHTYFNLSFLNVLWTLIAGVRYSHDDKILLDLIEKTNLIFKSSKVGDPSLMFPFIRKLFPEFFDVNKQLRAYAGLHGFFRETIKNHREDESYGTSGHFIDVFLQEVDKGNADTSFTEDQLICLLTDLFIAANETSSNTLEFGILYLILHPEIQEKVYQEILSVVGSQGPVSLEQHQSKLPYTEATIMEIQRLATIAPFTPPHRTTRDAFYRNYRIPKDTIVLLNLYSLNMDKDHWGDPEVFRPERFLNVDGSVKKDDNLIPFGIGQRFCLGESLAKMELFLYFSELIKTFKFATVPGHLDPTTEPINGLTLSPKPYNVVVTTR